MVTRTSGERPIWQYQTPATLNQPNPTQNLWYDLLPETENVRVYAIGVNIEDANEDVECQILVDGGTLGAVGATLTHSTIYYVYLRPEPISRVVDVHLLADPEIVRHGRAYLIEGLTVQIQVRKITALGAGNLTGVVSYAKK